MKRYHGGCYGCTQQEKNSLSFCMGCQYFNRRVDWDLPNLNNSEKGYKEPLFSSIVGEQMNPFKEAAIEIRTVLRSEEAITVAKRAAVFILVMATVILGIVLSIGLGAKVGEFFGFLVFLISASSTALLVWFEILVTDKIGWM